MEKENFSWDEKRKIWEKQYGNRLTGYDIFGRFVGRCGLEVYHILPKSRGGKTVIENAIILSPASNREKGEKLHGIINKKYFQVLNIGNGIGKIIINQ
ncbi:MAG: hypothetical protein HPPSJP_4920 [Candidatus Hepatoplasma scabrum]|nr:MAG: hypothetical protein HPPSJP_4920 [Candidatus Hepatoplasma sp.]